MIVVRFRLIDAVPQLQVAAATLPHDAYRPATDFLVGSLIRVPGRLGPERMSWPSFAAVRYAICSS